MDLISDEYVPPNSHYEYVVSENLLRSSKKEISQESAAEAKQKALESMSRCTGWCSLAKGEFLVDLVLKYQPQVIVEIGVWGGRSLIPMASALKSIGQGVVYGIDPWDSNESVMWSNEEANREFWQKADHNWVLRDLVSKIEQFQLGDQIELIKSTSEKASPIYKIGILHIDGNHAEETSYLDVTKWVPLVESGGWIILDDIHWFEKGKYTEARAVEWLNSHCIKFAEFSDSENSDWAVWTKP
jgi:predicted O-methyltransferase YrrM